MKPKTITLPARITAQQFGVREDIFNKQIKGKRLKVIDESEGFLKVAVKDCFYHVNESDLLPDGHDDVDKQERWQKAREAGQETENEW